jgi:hypothetical protein
MSSAEKRAQLLSGLLAQRGEAAPAKREAVAPPRPSEVIRFNERRAEAASVLYSKGAATAETFRPAQWTFDKEAQPAAAPSAPRARRINLIAVFGCLALAVSTGLFVLSRLEPGTPSPISTAPAAAPSAAAVLPQPRAEAPMPASPPPAVAAPEPPPPPAPVAAAAPPPEPAPPAPVAATAVAPAPQPAPPAASPPPADPQEIAGLVARADELLGTGDVVSARLFYQRAAELGSGPAATAVGQTYDPLFLEVARVRGVRGDTQAAAAWYRKAIALGDRQAEIRLRRLEGKPPG